MSLALPARVGWCPGALRPMRAGDGLLVRIKPRGGRLAPATLAAVAALAARHGNGALTLTSRANLQLRGISDDALPALTDALGALELLDANPEAEAVRNVVSSPFARSGDSVTGAAEALEERLAADPALWRLPPKFAWAVDGPGDLALGPLGADVHVTVEPDGRALVRLAGNGSGAWVVPGGLPDAVARLGEAFLALCAAEGLLPHRMHDLIGGGGTGRVFRHAGLKPGEAAPAARPPGASIIGPYHRAGASGIGVAFPFGLVTASTLACVASVAEHHSRTLTDDGVRLTPWRAVLLPGVPDADAIAQMGAIIDAADPRLGVAACIGAPGCGRATTEVPADAAVLAAALPPGRGVRLHVSGCAKGCAHAGPANLTLVGRDGAYDVVRRGRAGDLPVLRGLRPGQLAAMFPAVLAETGA